jgi:hypothetical protein
MRAALLLLILPTVATAADRPIDPAVAAAWGWTAKAATPPASKPATYHAVYARVLAGERVAFAAPLAGFTGGPGEWVGRLENGTPVMERKAVSLTANPFVPGLDSIPTTNAIGVVVRSSSSSGTCPPGVMYTLAPRAGTVGNTSDCPDGQP